MKVIKVSRKVSRDEPNQNLYVPESQESINEKAILEVTSSNQARTPVDPTAMKKSQIGLVELENMMRDKQSENAINRNVTPVFNS